MRQIILLAIVFLNGCVVDGPAVIPAKEAENLITQDCLYTLFINFPPDKYGESTDTSTDTGTGTDTTTSASPPLDYVEQSRESAAYLCNYDNHRYVNTEETYLVSSVNACRDAIQLMRTDNYEEFIVQYALIRNFVCDLKAIRFLDFTVPLQGGI